MAGVAFTDYPGKRMHNTLMTSRVVPAGILLVNVLSLVLFAGCAPTNEGAGHPRRLAQEGARSLVVKPGEDLQAAIDAARFGDTIILQAGGTYLTGGAPNYLPFYLRAKQGGTGTDADFITIRSSNVSSLSTGRVSPQDKANMAKIVARGPYGAFEFQNNARYWKLVGLEITNVSDGAQPHHVHTLVSLGGSGLDHNWIDRCYIHPQEDGTDALARTATRGIYVSSPPSGPPIHDTKITNNYISGFGGTYAHDRTQLIDAEAIGSNVLDTILVDNNFLSATYQPWFPGPADLTA